ncbi:hypothetical protein ACOSQ4_020333 [Xanthoceras sorbifolium]
MNALKKERNPESQKDLFYNDTPHICCFYVFFFSSSFQQLECQFHFRQGEVIEHGLLEESLCVATLLAAFRRTCSSFLKRYKESDNAEALFRQAMFEYFTLSKVESALELLKRAPKMEHVEATYLLTCLNNSSNKSRCQFRVIECRKRVRRMVSRLWVRNNNITRTCNCWSTQGMGRLW